MVPALLLGMIAPHAVAQTQPLPSPGDLKKLSVEELLDIDVTSVSRKEEPLSRAASAIQIITRADIRRSGATSIPEALRLATNLQVAQVDSRQWAITARGFNGTAANKLLVLIDGRTVYTPLFSGVFWDVQDTLLEDIDRIEVISGPGGTLWGANAVNGVINIITRSAKETQGLLLSGGGGGQLRDFVGVRYGGEIGARAAYRVYGKAFDRDSTRLRNGRDASDAWHAGQGGFRLDWQTRPGSTVTIQGDAYEGAINQLNVAADVEVSGRNITARWTRTLAPTTNFAFQFYYDYTHRVIPRVFSESLDIYDADFQHRFVAAKGHDVVWGLGVRVNDDHVGNTAVLAFLPPDLTTRLYSGFIQDDVSLAGGRLKLALGTKLEHNDFSGFEYQPSARLSLLLTDHQTLWGAVSRAVRSPSRIDRDFFVPPPLNLAGGPGFDSEKLLAYELGYRAQPRDNLSFSAATFYHRYDDLRTIEQTAPKILANGLAGEGYGAELTAIDQIAPWWRFHAGYTYLHLNLHKKAGSTDVSSAAQKGDSPQQQMLLRSSIDVNERLQWDIAIRYVGRLPNQRIDAYWGLDVQLAYLLRRDLEFSIAGRNLQNRDSEFGTLLNRKAIPRNIYGKITWYFR